MMTAQDIKEKTFEKAVFGGYDMGTVDDFLDEAANDFAALAKENAVLKSKMKVLVEKIEEYRSTEDAMRLALLSAQKMSAQIENEARAKADALTAESERAAEQRRAQVDDEVKSRLRDVKLEVATEQARLAEAKRSSSSFIENIRLMCAKQMEFLSALSDATPTQASAQPVVTNVVREAPAPAPAPVQEEPTRRFGAQEQSVGFEDLRFDIG